MAGFVRTLGLALLALNGCSTSDDGQPGTGGAHAMLMAGAGGADTAGAPATGGAGGTPPGSAGQGGTGTGGSPLGTAGKSAASGAGGGGGAAGALPDCLSPCLWELFKDCRPERSCTSEHESGSSVYVECEAATGYRFDATLDTSDGHADPDMVVSKNGRLCYTANYVAPTWTYADPSGAVVATATTGTETTTGTCPALDGPGAAPETYRIDTRDPRCALIDCTPGSCP